MNVKAPGKIILSGEHAVVHGYPALAMAINHYVNVEVGLLLSPEIAVYFKELRNDVFMTIAELTALCRTVRERYQAFLQGKQPISTVLGSPKELALFALSLLFDAYPYHLSSGIHVTIESSLPQGCGLGSSAAVILAVLSATEKYLQLNLSKEELYRLALEAENAQHGHSSGMDILVEMLGGCIFRDRDEIILRAAPKLTMYAVNTGTPDSTTGECVAATATYFKQSEIGHEFKEVTHQMDQALQANDFIQFKQAIQKNHELLTRINVVPEKVRQFIVDVEQIDGAAKICGAGAVTGDKAGMVLAIVDDESKLIELTKQYRYTMLPIECELRGVYEV